MKQNSMILDTLATTLSGNILAGEGVIRLEKGKIRGGQDF